MQSLLRTLPQTFRLLSHNWCCNSVLKGQLFQDGGNMVRPVDSMILCPLSRFSAVKLSSLLRNNTVWNTMRVDKAFCKSTGSSLGRKNMCNKSKSITRTSIYSSKDKVLSFLLRKWSKCINLLPGCWLVTP